MAWGRKWRPQGNENEFLKKIESVWNGMVEWVWVTAHGEGTSKREPLTGPGTGQAFRKADLPPVSTEFPM